MPKVFIGVGHGGSDYGASSGGLIEKNLALVTALACKDFLVAHGVGVKMSREIDENDTISQEVQECNQYRPNLAVEIHYNAGGGDGLEIYRYRGGGESLKAAQKVETRLLQGGQNSRGIKVKLNNQGTDYYIWIRETKAPAILIEVGFVDNPTDRQLFDTEEEQRKLGQTIAYGILDFFNISFKHVTTTQTITVSTDKIYRVQVGAFKNISNAEKLKNELSTKGYSSFITNVNGLYKVQVGAFRNKVNAQKLVNELKSKGYNSFIS